jgi:cytochrome c biogenesis protein CcmG/thiol:disulfide interchange protein DsbE
VRRVLAGLCLGLVLTGCTAEDRVDPETLPDVTLPAIDDGNWITDVADLDGPLVVPLFASWCGPCRKELPLFERFYREHGDEVDVLGINWSDPQKDAALALMDETGVTFPVLADPKGETGEPPNVRIPGLPTLWLVDADGTVTFREARKIDSYDELLELVETHLDVTL